jgi:glycosyltransferase involved in cell wall biosynthesis
MALRGGLAGEVPAAAVTAWKVNDYGPDLWRLIFPVQALAADGYPAVLLDGRAPRAWEHLTSQAVLLSRPTGDTTAWFDSVRDARLVLLADFDDDVFSDAYYPQWARFAGERASEATFAAAQARSLAALRCMHGVTVTSPALAALVERQARCPVAVVPNAIPYQGWGRACRGGARPPAGGPVIGWLGGSREDADVVPMVAGWAAIAARSPTARFVVAGPPPAVITAALPPDRLIVRPWQPITRYPTLFAGVDIGCCPLAATTWNTHKSPCKAFEYAAAGAAVVASTPVYRRVLRPGTDALIADTAAEWTAALARLLDDAAYRAALAASWARRVQAQHSLETQRHRWATSWTQLTRRQLARTSSKGPRL